MFSLECLDMHIKTLSKIKILDLPFEITSLYIICLEHSVVFSRVLFHWFV